MISNDALREYLVVEYCSNPDGVLSPEDLARVEFLEIATEEFQFWDEDNASLVMNDFQQLEDLECLPNLKVLALSGQPAKGSLTLPDTVEEVCIERCLGIHLTIDGEEFDVPPSPKMWFWKKGMGHLEYSNNCQFRLRQ